MIDHRQSTSLPAAPKSTGGALGTGLMALGGVIAALILLWLLVNLAGGQLRAGGFVFGLILLALLALPPIGVGWYLRARGVAEAIEAQTFAERRRILDADRLLRRELQRELNLRIAGLNRALPALPPEPARLAAQAISRLRDLVQLVERPGYDAAAWLERTAVQLDAAALDHLSRFDDLILEEARRLEAIERRVPQDAGAAGQLVSAVDRLASRVREREALFGRGRAAPVMAPQELLAAARQLRRPVDQPLDLGIDDAVSYDGDDYLVRSVLTYFAGGRSWKTYQLHDGRNERWLDVRAGGSQLAWLETHGGGGSPEDDSMTLNGIEYRRQEHDSATVGVESAAGRQEGVFVEYSRYVSPSGLLLVVEQWPDGVRALLGHPVSRERLQLWTRPATTE